MKINRHNAFTLLELLIALGITVLIGGTVVTMIMSVSQGTNISQDGRRYFVRSQMLQNRMRDIVERSRCVLATSSTMATTGGKQVATASILFWFDEVPGPAGTDDGNGNPTSPPTYLTDRLLVNRNEIVLIEWDSASQNVCMYYADMTPLNDPAATTDTPGSTYPTNWSSAEYMAEVQKIKGQITGLSQVEIIGTHVTDFRVNVYPSAEPLENAVYVNAMATIGSDLNIRPVLIGAKIRQRMTPK